MRHVNSMIECKQIVGRGTRLVEGKDYFTLLDFVDAYKHFSDPEWDGEPISEVKEESTKDSAMMVCEPSSEYDSEENDEEENYNVMCDCNSMFDFGCQCARM